MAGAKLLGNLASPPNDAASDYIDAYNQVWNYSILPYLTPPGNETEYPDIILLQECIGFIKHSEQRSRRWNTGAEILASIFENYTTFFFPALSSYTHPHPKKWEQYRQGVIKGNYIPGDIEAQQGYGICVRDPSMLRKIWVPYEDDIPEDSDDPQNERNYHLCFESVGLTTGAYLGNRDTEPRLAIRGRLKVPDANNQEFRYVNFINIHLTTLKGERTGSIRINNAASSVRMNQLNLILNNIISAYHESDKYRMPVYTSERKSDIWIVGGDFNSTEISNEIRLMNTSGFVDCIPDKRIVDATNQLQIQVGTKWSINNRRLPAIVLDYIMCGLERTSFPVNTVNTTNSRRPFRPRFPGNYEQFETDHALLVADIEV